MGGGIYAGAAIPPSPSAWGLTPFRPLTHFGERESTRGAALTKGVITVKTLCAPIRGAGTDAV
jgi:hypothetical protein